MMDMDLVEMAINYAANKSSAKTKLFQNEENIRLILDDTTRSRRKKWAWTDENVSRANDIVKVMNDIHKFWPLGERQIYYRLISSTAINQEHWHKYGKIENPIVSDVCGTIGPLLKWLRINGNVPWDAIQDNTRTLTEKAGFSSAKKYVQNEVERMFKYYSRCVAEDQPYHIEIWIEKEGLLNIVEPIADKYCRRVLACKGYNSITFQADFYDRTSEAISRGYKPVILYFGDWDPSGCNMIYAAMQTLQDELDLDMSKVIVERCGINPAHFSTLPENPDPVPIKKTDTRTNQFIKNYGSTCYELDAFHPVALQQLVEKSIQRYTNMDSITCNLDVEKKELNVLAALKKDAAEYITAKFENLQNA